MNCQREWERARAIQGLRRDYLLSDLLKVSGMARSTFYYYLKRLSEPDKYQEEKDLIKQIFYANKGTYGYRRIWMELRREGFLINHKTVRKLMTIVGIKCMVRVKKYHSCNGEAGKIAPNLLQRNFHVNWMN